MPQENINQYPQLKGQTPEPLLIENQQDQKRLENIRAKILAKQQSENPTIKFAFSDINIDELEPSETSQNWDEKSQALKEYDKEIKIHIADKKAKTAEKGGYYDPKTDSRANLAGAIRHLLIEKSLAKRKWKKSAGITS